MDIDDAFLCRFVWGDEPHFYLNVSVNTHICRIRDSEQPHVVLETPLHLPKDIV